MMRAATIPSAWVISALLILLAACGNQTPASTVDSGVRGAVVSGPQCPVETIENPCPDLPVSGIVVSVTAPDGSATTETRTDAEGRFKVAVAPGEYVVQPVVDGGGVTFAKPVQVIVSDGRFVQVTLHVDTGIR
jgi:hypothetical protein